MADLPMTIAVSGFVDTLRGGRVSFVSLAPFGVSLSAFLMAGMAVAVATAGAGELLTIASGVVTAACGSSGFGKAGTVVDGGDGAPFCGAVLTIGVAIAFIGGAGWAVDTTSFALFGSDLPKSKRTRLEIV